MKLLFKQRLFSWLDSYDIYNELGETVYTVKGELALGHKLNIYDRNGTHLGIVREELFTFLPRFRIIINGQDVGCIKKEFTFFKPVFTLDYKNWTVEGDFFDWDYEVTDGYGNPVITASRQLFNLTDTFVIEYDDKANELTALMIVLAIDAAKCSQRR
ncbi:MAG: hypothetical protein IKV63_04825 [Clostridia bacterium]|nr:hypothetical protein [Clostridia bacterium]